MTDTSDTAVTVEPGGVWRFVVVGPDGAEFPNRIVSDEVEEPHRLAYTHGSPDDPSRSG